MPNEEEKICFVISPIGEPDTEIRERSDKVLRGIIEPIVGEFGYKTLRADEISDPGIITGQIIQHLINDALVIADLTSHNPNVFYEHSVRHAIRRPTIQIIDKNQSIPFDVLPVRTIKFDITDFESVDACRNAIREQITIVEKDPSKTDNPIANAIDLQAYVGSGKSQDTFNAQILDSIQNIKYEIRRMSESKISSGVVFTQPNISSGYTTGVYPDGLIIRSDENSASAAGITLYPNVAAYTTSQGWRRSLENQPPDEIGEDDSPDEVKKSSDKKKKNNKDNKPKE